MRRFHEALAAALVLTACSQNAAEHAAATASAVAGGVTFRRGSGAVVAGREVCDDRVDPRAQNALVVTMDRLRPADVTATLSPSATEGPDLTVRVDGTADVLTTSFFQAHGEDCWAGVKELVFAGGSVWRSAADVVAAAGSCAGACGGRSRDGCWCDDRCAAHGDCCADEPTACRAPKPPPGSCAGRCGGAGSGRCYCDERCVAKGDCCADAEPLCRSDGLGGPPGADDLVFDRSRPEPRFRGEDWTGHTVRYDYRRLVDAHPECVERTADGGSRVAIVMRAQLGRAPATEQIVSGYSTSPAEPVAVVRDVALPTRGVDLNLRFRCGSGARSDAAVDDNGGAGYSIYIVR